MQVPSNSFFVNVHLAVEGNMCSFLSVPDFFLSLVLCLDKQWRASLMNMMKHLWCCPHLLLLLLRNHRVCLFVWLQVFLSSRAVYVIVFNLCHDLSNYSRPQRPPSYQVSQYMQYICFVLVLIPGYSWSSCRGWAQAPFTSESFDVTCVLCERFQWQQWVPFFAFIARCSVCRAC